MKRLFSLAASLVIALSAAAVVRTSVSAATNGQQAAYSPSCYSNWAYSVGQNQNNRTAYRWFEVYAATPEGGCFAPLSYDYGWWWKGTVKTEGFWNYGYNYTGTTYTWFPACCPTSNWVVVTMP